MPDLQQPTPQENEMPPAMRGVDASLPGIARLTGLPSVELTDTEMAEQVRRLLAYVLQTPEGKNDPEIWMKGFNYKKLAAFAKEEMDRNDTVPFIILYVLDYIWKNVAKSRERIGGALGIVKDADTDEFPATFPCEPHIDDNKWLANYKQRLMQEAQGLTGESVSSLIVDRGRETVTEVILGVLRKNRPLRDDEKEAIENMAQTITSAEVIKAILPFAEEDPWIGIHLLKNFALADPAKRIEGLAKQVDFTNAINNLIEASREDMDIANELAKILSNSHTDRIITQVKFKDVANSIMSDPVQHSNMAIALLDHPAFDMRHIANLTERTIAAYMSGECDVKCRNILIEVSGYLSRFMNKFIEKAYKGISVGHVHREDLQNIISEEEFEQIKKAKAISDNLNTVSNVNLCRYGIDEVYNAIRLLKKRGSKTLLKRFYEQHMAPLEIIDEDAELPDNTIVKVKLHSEKALAAQSSSGQKAGSRKKKPKRKSENRKNKKPRKALATKRKDEMARLAEKRKNGN